MTAAPGVEYGAPAAIVLGVDETIDLNIEIRVLKRFCAEPALPFAIALHCAMLQHSAAEIRTNQSNAVASCPWADLLVLHYVPEVARSSNGSTSITLRAAP